MLKASGGPLTPGFVKASSSSDTAAFAKPFAAVPATSSAYSPEDEPQAFAKFSIGAPAKTAAATIDLRSQAPAKSSMSKASVSISEANSKSGFVKIPVKPPAKASVPEGFAKASASRPEVQTKSQMVFGREVPAKASGLASEVLLEKLLGDSADKHAQELASLQASFGKAPIQAKSSTTIPEAFAKKAMGASSDQLFTKSGPPSTSKAPRMADPPLDGVASKAGGCSDFAHASKGGGKGDLSKGGGKGSGKWGKSNDWW